MRSPSLRFPGFDEQWSSKSIKEVAKVTSGLTPLRSNSKYFDCGTIPWVKTLDLNNSLIRKTVEKVTERAMSETSLRMLPENTLLVAMYGGFNQIGRTGIIMFEGTTNQAISALIPIENAFNPFFLQSYLNFNVKKWQRYAASSRKDPNITKKDIENFIINIPSKEEQDKVSNFDTLLNRRIEKQQEKVDVWREYKKGMMQMIFSQKLHFKDDDGNNFPVWEKISLGEIASIEKGIQINKSELNLELSEGLYPVYNGGINLSGYHSLYNREPNSIIISEGGNSCGYVNFIKEYFWSGGHSYTLTVERPIDKQYLYQLLKSHEKKIMTLRVGSGLPNIQKSDLQKFLITTSLSHIEQYKIGKLLSTIDEKVKKEEEKLGVFKKQRQSFLKRMFV